MTRYEEESLDGKKEYEKAVELFQAGFKLAKTNTEAAIRRFEEAEKLFDSCDESDKAQLARANITAVRSGDEPQGLA
jgi:exonuclease VII small subunit